VKNSANTSLSIWTSKQPAASETFVSVQPQIIT